MGKTGNIQNICETCSKLLQLCYRINFKMKGKGLAQLVKKISLYILVGTKHAMKKSHLKLVNGV